MLAEEEPRISSRLAAAGLVDALCDPGPRAWASLPLGSSTALTSSSPYSISLRSSGPGLLAPARYRRTQPPSNPQQRSPGHLRKGAWTMNDVTRFEIGAEVHGPGGSYGQLRRVVVDPIARTVTHLVVEPKHRWGLGHLVPVGLVDTAGVQIVLTCTQPDFDGLESADETRFVPGTAEGYGSGQMLMLPYYGLGLERMGGIDGLGGNSAQPVVHDKVPVGEVEVHRGDRVHATDGDIGRVQGLVIDPRDHQVTHVLLQEGHLLGRKEVAIPIRRIKNVDDGIRLTIAKDEVRDLPPVDLDHGPLG